MSGLCVQQRILCCASRPSQGNPMLGVGCGSLTSKLATRSFPYKCRPLEQALAPIRHRQPVVTQVFPFDQAWAPSLNAASVAPQLFAMSLFPYLCFLYYLTKSGKTPRLTLFGFYFLLVFVGATIPAGIYAKSHYGTSLANVDWLHGAAESLLTITNLLIVLGLRQGIREAEVAREQQQQQAAAEAEVAVEMAPEASAVSAAEGATSNRRV